MYEHPSPPAIGESTRFASRDPSGRGHVIDSAGAGDSSAEIAGDALRMIEWAEVVGRLKAARDLRCLFRHDARKSVTAAGGSFSDAAARYFREREECEGVVNPVALERSKGSSGIVSERSGAGATGPQARRPQIRDTQQKAMREKIDD